MTKQQITDAAIRDFLLAHPEHIQGTRQDIEHGTVIDTDTLIAFTDWTIKTGRGDTKKAKNFRQELRRKFGK